MSGLAALLAKRRPPGVYRWSARSSSVAVRHTVEHVGWRFVHLDTRAVEDEQAFLDAAADALAVPAARAGWDRLDEALSEVGSVRDASGTVALWDGWGSLARAEPQAFESAVTRFRQRVDRSDAGTFVVLLRGDGPPVDVPEIR